MSTTQQGQPQGQQQEAASPQQIAKAKNDVIKMVRDALAIKKPKMPNGYDLELALEMAGQSLLELKTKTKSLALLSCTPESIANAVYKMAVKGHYIHLNHCAFIAYGNKIMHQDQYQGRIMQARRDWGLTKIVCDVVYKGDTLDVIRNENGEKMYRHISGPFSERKTDLASIVGAWCYLFWSDGNRTAHEMTLSQIESAWKKGFGTGDTHLAFSEKMALKTTITSALTLWGNTNPSINIETAHEADVEEAEYEIMPQAAPQSLPEAPKVEPMKFTTEAPKVEVKPTEAQVMAQQAINFDEKPSF